MTAPNPWLQVGPDGRTFLPLEPGRFAVLMTDIVPALAKMCRFGGHCREFYSVAQHSVLVSQLVPAHLARTALLHDAAEAFTGDIVQPLKEAIRISEATSSGRPWTLLIKEIERVVAHHLSVIWPLPAEVKHADLRALATEQRDLMPPPRIPWMPMPAPHPDTITPLDWRRAEQAFWCRLAEVEAMGACPA
jgi:hypothetical protein